MQAQQVTPLVRRPWSPATAIAGWRVPASDFTESTDDTLDSGGSKEKRKTMPKFTVNITRWESYQIRHVEARTSERAEEDAVEVLFEISPHTVIGDNVEYLDHGIESVDSKEEEDE